MTDENTGDAAASREAAPSGEEADAPQTESPTATATATAAAEDEPLFTEEELRQFNNDDFHAGSVIGKMLALFFFYTVVIMAWVSWKTWVLTS